MIYPGSFNGVAVEPNLGRAYAHSAQFARVPGRQRFLRRDRGAPIERDGRSMVDLNSKIAGLSARILRAGAVHSLTMAALLLAGSSALAQANRGTEQ